MATIPTTQGHPPVEADVETTKNPSVVGEVPDSTSREAREIPPSEIPFHRGTRWQALVIAATFICGPGMNSALGALGAGGLKDPTLVNITSGMGYGLIAFFSFFGGVFVNLLGVRLVLSIGIVSFSVSGASLYCNNKYGTVWFLYFSQVLQGFCAAILWIAQGAVTLAYPEPHRRGFFISTWYASLSLGGIIGGIIALAFNARSDKAGKITPISYLPLIAISAVGPFIALLLAPPEKVIRTDGKAVQVNKLSGPWEEAKRAFGTLRKKEILLLVPMFLYSQWFLSYNGTFVTVYHSVRGRALGGLLNNVFGAVGTAVFFFMSDRLGWSRRQVARRGFFIIFTLYGLNWIYATIVQRLYASWNPIGLDWAEGEYWLSMTLYIYWSFIDNIYQCYMYFILGTLSDEVDTLARYTSIMKAINTAGAALGYGVQVKWSMMGAEALLCGLFFIQIVPTWFVVRDVQDDEQPNLVVNSDEGDQHAKVADN